MNLVLDTNILHQESLTSANMRTLLRLIEADVVTICLPSLVRREYLTKVNQDCSAKFQTASASIDRALRMTKISRLHAQGVALHGSLVDLVARLSHTYEEDFNAWSVTYRVRTIEFDPASMPAVIDDYFSGAPPFRSQKSREDILDAMISTSINSLIYEGNEVVVVMQDGMFRRYLEQRRDLSVFEGLSAFLRSERVAAEIARLDIAANTSQFLTALSSVNAYAALAEHALSDQAALDSIYLEGDEVGGITNLAMDCFGVRINGPKAENVISLQLSHVDYIGQDQYSFAFLMKARARVDFCSSYGEYLELSYEREQVVSLESMNGAGICDLEEVRLVSITGKLNVNIGVGTSLEELEELLRLGAHGISRFKFEFEANSGAVLLG